MSYIIFVTFLQVTVLHNIISLYLKVQYMLKARLVNKIGYKSLFHMSSWLFQWEREAGFLEDWIKQIIPIVNLPLRLRILTVAKASTPPIFYCLLMPVLFVLSNCLSHFFSFYDCNCWLKLGNRILNWTHKIRKTQHNENKMCRDHMLAPPCCRSPKTARHLCKGRQATTWPMGKWGCQHQAVYYIFCKSLCFCFFLNKQTNINGASGIFSPQPTLETSGINSCGR